MTGVKQLQELRAEVNLFVDHSHIVQLECLRSGLWGTKSLWGRVLTYKDTCEEAENRKEQQS